MCVVDSYCVVVLCGCGAYTARCCSRKCVCDMYGGECVGGGAYLVCDVCDVNDGCVSDFCRLAISGV